MSSLQPPLIEKPKEFGPFVIDERIFASSKRDSCASTSSNATSSSSGSRSPLRIRAVKKCEGVYGRDVFEQKEKKEGEQLDAQRLSLIAGRLQQGCLLPGCPFPLDEDDED